MAEDYNGWSNWDTWNTNLWLSNDEYVWKAVRNICRLAYRHETDKQLITLAKEVIPATEGINYANVDWEEIYNAVNEE
jgi:hypothetical protein